MLEIIDQRMINILVVVIPLGILNDESISLTKDESLIEFINQRNDLIDKPLCKRT